MNVIKTNYNNAFVKKPSAPTPNFFAYKRAYTENEETKYEIKIFINDYLEREPFFTNYFFSFYVNNVFYGTYTKSEGNLITIRNLDLNELNPVTLFVKGFYVSDINSEEEIESKFIEIKSKLVCSNYVICGNQTIVTESHEGYLNPNDNTLYKVLEDENYSIPIEPIDNGIYLDLLTNYFYKWNSEQECYILI